MNLIDLAAGAANLPEKIARAAESASTSFLNTLRQRVGNSIALPTLSSRRPIYRIEIDGRDISSDIEARLISMTVIDNQGFEADQLDVALSDHDGGLALPARGALVTVAIGWEDTGLVDKGSFTVDETEHSGAPDVLTIRARSADMRGGLTTQRERSWHGNTIGQIVATIADEVGLKPLVSTGLANSLIQHIDQTNESAANLLQRIAGMFDAFSTVKAGRLIFAHAGAGITASGKPLPSLTITRKSGDRHRFSIADRRSYNYVKASWNQISAADKGEVIWGDAEDDAERNKPPEPVPTAASAQRIKLVDRKQVSRAKAYQLAKKEWKALSSTRNQYDAVQVPYNDRTMAVSGVVTYGKTDEANARKTAQKKAEQDKHRATAAEPVVAIATSPADNIKVLRHVYANQTNAIRAARAEWRRIKRGVATFSITLAEGVPELGTEQPVNVQDFKPDIDGTDWICKRAMHTLVPDSGLTTAAELEMRATEIPD